MLEGRLVVQGLQKTRGSQGRKGELDSSSGQECPAGRREKEDKNKEEEVEPP